METTTDKDQEIIIEGVETQDEIKQLIEKALESFRKRDSILLKEKIILTYDAGGEINKDRDENAKKEVLKALYNIGARKFHSPTRSTIVFEVTPNSFATWQYEIKRAFKKFEEVDDFFYSIALINSGANYFDKPDDTLNDSIPDILKS